MNKVKDVIEVLEKYFPLNIQESWDNCGLQVGDIEQEVTGVLCAIDITEEIIDEAIHNKCNLIVTHHPPLFHSIKSIDSSNYIKRSIIKAIKNDISIYSAHTSSDNSPYGLNFEVAKELGLNDIEVLLPQKDDLLKFVTYIPNDYVDVVSKAVFSAGAGNIGNYDCCSYNVNGVGSFRALEGANPFIGNVGVLHKEDETLFSAVLPRSKQHSVLKALITSHPYEEPAYSFQDITTFSHSYGSGAVGNLDKPIETEEFLHRLKEYFVTDKLAYSKINKSLVSRIAICTGAGAFLLNQASRVSADLFITGEAKYNDYFDAQDGSMLVTVGHYESELISQRIFASIIIDNFTNFAVHTSGKDINPIKYI